MIFQRTIHGWLVAACTAALAATAAASPATPPARPSAAARGSAMPVMPRVQLGIAALSISPELRAHLGAPADRGVLVDHVATDSAAEHAGIQVGDLVLEVAGRPATSARAIREALRGHAKGDRVAIAVLRDGKRLDLSATLDAAAPTPAGALGDLQDLFPDLHEDFPDLAMPRGNESLRELLDRAREMFRHIERAQEPGVRT